MSLQLAIMARAPVPGQCKTRLIPALGAEGAADLHARLLEHTLNHALTVPEAQVTLWVAGDLQHPFFEQLSQKLPGLNLKQQPLGDLGQRMHAVFAHQQRQPTLLMGSDCPLLTPELLTHCARQLLEKDAVFLPAEDGGYALVGLKEHCWPLFSDQHWGHSQVMATARQRLLKQELSWAEPEVVWDVDRPEDLCRLAELAGFSALVTKSC